LAICVVLLSSGFVALVRWRQGAVRWDAAQMVAALPVERATVFYADVDALRKAGILDLLAGSKAAEETDYRNFVEQIGFDYRTDLDAVAGAFVNGESFFTVRGRFQWKQLAEYARMQGGECRYTTCSLPANEPGRKISFYPLRSDILALAVTSEHSGVEMIAPGSAKMSGPVATDPAWVTIPASALTKPGALPPSLQVLLGSAARAESITFAAGPQGERLQLRLSVVCKTAQDAQAVKEEFSSATDALRKSSLSKPARAGQPAPGQPDWAGFLRGGMFVRNGTEVTGTWPIEQSFLLALVSGGTP